MIDDKIRLLKVNSTNGETHIVNRSVRTKAVTDVHTACGKWKEVRDGETTGDSEALRHILFEGTSADVTCPQCRRARGLA